MKIMRYVLTAVLFMFSTVVQAQYKEEMMDREQRTRETYEALFASPRTPSRTDQEFMDILQKFIFGEVFYIGDLDYKTRELITVVALTTMQTLPQLKAHINAALNIGNTPLEVREAIYGCAPFIGFPRTLNAIAVFNEVMKERGVELPLEEAATITEENRFARGTEIQQRLYGDEIKQVMESLPGIYKNEVPNVLTKFCFADFYTRKGLSIRQRELLSLVVLTTLGAEKQLEAHVIGNLKAGNDKEVLLAAMIQAAPYTGLPNVMSAINIIKNADAENYRSVYE